jgi:hypothetical protein
MREYLEECLAALRSAATPDPTDGEQVAEILYDFHRVAWRASAVLWRQHARSMLASHVRHFRQGLDQLPGRHSEAIRSTVWSLWMFAEAGTAQEIGRLYRSRSLDCLRTLQDLMPSGRQRFGQLIDSLGVERRERVTESRADLARAACCSTIA